MARKSLFSPEQKLHILQELEQGGHSLLSTAYKYGIDPSTLKEWRRRYNQFGLECLEPRFKNTSYSAEFKIKVVQEYLSGNYSQRQIIDIYKIASRAQLRDWISKYNSYSIIKSNEDGGTCAMTKGRSTSWQERIDIVLYCLAHNNDYNDTSKKYSVSYQQVYKWVKKYEDGGPEALKDGRGRNRSPEELNDTDKQKLAMKKLEYENERLRAENALLKKLQELERWRF